MIGEIPKTIYDELWHLADHDAHVRAALTAIRCGADPVTTLCKAIVAMSGAVESHRQTLTVLLQNLPHPVTIPLSEFRRPHP